MPEIVIHLAPTVDGFDAVVDHQGIACDERYLSGETRECRALIDVVRQHALRLGELID